MGMVIMILAVATGNGLRTAIQDKVTGFGGDIQVINYQPNPAYEQAPVIINDSILKTIKELEGVSKIQPFAFKAGILKEEDLFEGAVLKGVDSSYHWENFEKYITTGKIPRFDNRNYQDSVLLSERLVDRLGLKLHDRLSMFFVRSQKAPLRRNFIIAGIFKTDFEDIDDQFLIGDLKHVRRLNQWSDVAVGGYEILGEKQVDTESLSRQIRLLIPFAYDALTARALNPQLFQWLDLFDLNIMIILIIIIAVATINMSIALLILIMERTRMIGVLKTLGARNGLIQRSFLLQASFLIGKGLAWGNLIGIGLAWLQKHYQWVKLDPETYYVTAVSIDLNPWYLLSINLLTLLVCLFCLLLPSLLITKIKPAQAIRFE
jgi:lipoprotein-releasing system permease protein